MPRCVTTDFINVVATLLWGVCVFGAGRSGRRTAPWLQRVRTYEMASRPLALLILESRSRRRSATADLSCGQFGQFESATGRTRRGELVSHFLQARSKRFNLLLLLFGGRLLLCDNRLNPSRTLPPEQLQ